MMMVLMLMACSKAPSLPEGVARINAVSQQEKIVRAFIEAFNAHDPEAMIALCAEDIRWGYATQTTHDFGGRGTAQLVQEMKTYFASISAVRSEISSLAVTGDTIAMAERVYWTDAGIEKTQSSIAVYQLQDNRIQSVWYYPVQP